MKILNNLDERNPCGEIKLPGSRGYCSGFGYSFVLVSKGKILAFSEMNKEYYFTDLLSNEDCIIIKKGENETIQLLTTIMGTKLFQADFPSFNHQLK